MKQVRYTRQKLIISGTVFERSDYDAPVRIDPLPQSKTTFPIIRDRERRKQRQGTSIYRSKKRLKRLINANVGFHIKKNKKPYKPIFITFTFKENLCDLKIANYTFTKFIQRFNYELFDLKKSILKYVVAVEFQKRGAIHYHVVFFNLPYRKGMKGIVSELWGEGFIKVETVKNTIHDVGNYLTKYMTKELADPRLVGKKCYFSSQNLFKPIVIKDPEKVAFIIRLLKPEQVVYERIVESSGYGPGYKYQIYNVENPGFVRGILDLFVRPGYFDGKL
jgi:hypothetical protein